MDQMHHIIIVNERKLVAIKPLHAARLKLPNRDFTLTSSQIELFVSELDQFLDHGQQWRVLFMAPDCFNHRFCPLFHQILIRLIPLKRLRVHIVEVFGQQLLDLFSHVLLLLLDFQLGLVELAFIVLETLDAA